MTAVGVTTAQFTVIAANSSRKGLVLYNNSGVNVRISDDEPVSLATSSWCSQTGKDG